ncbi:hypothetical protein [Halomonas ramblicola]|uniref:hypothetical protein n=1 Tax=Halomonas ramblicola TaxID=747349 RepID=UPI003F49A26A
MLALADRSREALTELAEEISGRITLEVHCALARHGTPRHPHELARRAWIDLLDTAREGLTPRRIGTLLDFLRQAVPAAWQPHATVA